MGVGLAVGTSVVADVGSGEGSGVGTAVGAANGSGVGTAHSENPACAISLSLKNKSARSLSDTASRIRLLAEPFARWS